MSGQTGDGILSGESDQWRLFHGDGVERAYPLTPGDRPNWRRFHDGPDGGSDPEPVARYLIDPDQADVVTAAIRLNRPLLVTGFPGTGKSSLAEAIARELALGPVLRWSVNSRSTVQEALYRYDAIGRLQETNLRRQESEDGGTRLDPPDIGLYVRLGPLGTALTPSERPRVLLVDEFDKGDLDLPNDLLSVFEEGLFEIPELTRLPDGTPPVTVMTGERGRTVEIAAGEVRCTQFPVVVITSNGERDFPAAFLRRCVPLHLRPPGPERLREIVAEHLGTRAMNLADDLITAFLGRRERDGLATDQIMNAVFLRMGGARLESSAQLLDNVLHKLNGTD